MLAIANFTYYPYGNARGYEPNVECQHGPNECLGNKIEACLMHLNPKPTTWVQALVCMESGTPYANWKKCASENSPAIETAPIESCIEGSLGNQLINDAARATNSLNPPHQYTPWITINGKPKQGSLIREICDAYTGTKPSGCSSPSSSSGSSGSSSGSSSSAAAADYNLPRDLCFRD